MIGEAELSALCGLSSLEIPEERRKAVLENLQRMAQVAAVVNAAELGPEDELGPQWWP